jgi:hypothetical protein
VVAPFQSINDHTHQLWDEYEEPPSSLAAPEGFTITPAQAYQIVTHGDPQKFAWYVYADQTNYYLVKHAPLLIPTSGYARKYGAQVDGRSGLCLQRCPGQNAAP